MQSGAANGRSNIGQLDDLPRHHATILAVVIALAIGEASDTTYKSTHEMTSVNDGSLR